MLSRLNPLQLIRFIIESDLLFPLILILVYAIFWYFATGIIPTPDQLINSFGMFYQKYGYEIIVAAALIESLVGIGILAPGGAALVLGVIFSRTGQTNLILVIIFAVMGSMLGYLIDYCLGYYGFSDFLKKFGLTSKEESSQIKKISSKAMFFTFIYGNFGSVASVAAGAVKYDLKKFIITALVSTIFWATFWSLLVFALGTVVLTILSRYIFIVVIAFILGSILMRLRKRKGAKKS